MMMQICKHTHTHIHTCCEKRMLHASHDSNSRSFDYATVSTTTSIFGKVKVISIRARTEEVPGAD